MNDNTRYKIDLWRSLNTQAAMLETRSPLTLVIMASLCAATLLIGLILQAHIIIYLVPALAFITLNIASSNMRKSGALKGYLRYLESKINEEMQASTYLWNLEAVDRFYRHSLPCVLATALSVITAGSVLGYIIVYMLFVNRAPAFSTPNANLIFKIIYIALLAAATIGTLLGFLGNYAVADDVQKWMAGESPAEEDWKPPFDESQ